MIGKALKITLLAWAAGLVIVVLGCSLTLAWVLFFDSGTRVAVRLAEDWYDNRVEGHVGIERVEGNISEGIVLRGVQLSEAGGQPLVRAREVTLGIDLGALLSGRVRVAQLHVSGGEVVLRIRNGRSSFVDLGFAGSTAEENTPKRSTSVPRLPFPLELGHLIVDDAALLDSRGVESVQLAHLERLVVGGAWAGVAPYIRVHEITGEYALSEKVLSVRSGQIAAAIPNGNQLAARVLFQTNLGQLRVEGSLELSAELVAQMTVHAESSQFEQLGLARGGHAEVLGLVRLRRDRITGLDATALLDCEKCTVNPLGDIELEAAGGLQQGKLTAQLWSSGGGFALEARASGAVGRELGVNYRARILDGAVIGHSFDLGSLDGDGLIDGACRIKGTDFGCTGDIALAHARWNAARVSRITGNARFEKDGAEQIAGVDLDFENLMYEKLQVSKGRFALSLADDRMQFSLRGQNRKGENASSRGSVARGDAGVDIRLDTLESSLLGIPVISRGPVHLKLSDTSGSFQRAAEFAIGDGTVRVWGHLGGSDGNRMQARFKRLDLAHLGTLLGRDDLSGRIGGEVSLRGMWRRPRIAATVRGRGLRLGPTVLSRLDWNADYRAGKIAFDFEALRHEQLVASASGEVPASIDLEKGIVRWRKRGSGEVAWKTGQLTHSELANWISLPPGLLFETSAEGTLRQEKGRLYAKGQVEGWLEHGSVPLTHFRGIAEVRPEGQTVRVEAQAEEGAPLRLDVASHFDLVELLGGEYRSERYRVDLDVGEGTVAVTGRLGSLDYLSAHLVVEKINLDDVDGYVGQKLNTAFVSGYLDGELELQVEAGRPSGDFDFRLGDIVFEELVLGGARFDGDYRDEKLRLRLAEQNGNSARVELVADTDIVAILEGRRRLKDVRVSGDLLLDDFNLDRLNLMNLDSFSGWAGRTTIQMTFAGTVGRPLFQGAIAVADGGFSLAGWADPIRALQADVVFDAQKLDIRSLKFASGAGNASITAGAVRQGQDAFSLALDLKTQKLPVGLRGLPRFVLDSRGKVQVRVLPDLVDIVTTVDDATISKPAGAGSAALPIPANKNVIIAEEFNRRVQSDTEQRRALRISVEAPNEVRVTGRDLDTYWNAQLVFNRAKGATRIDGHVRSTKGKFSLLGNTFNLDRGDLTFGEKMEEGAYLDLAAKCQLSGTNVQLDVSGNIMRPSLALSSSPALSEEQILSLLLSGTSEKGSEGAGMLGTMLSMKYPLVKNLLYNRFGISEFKVSSSPDGGASIRVGRKVTEKSHVYTAYNPSARSDENEFELTVETRFSSRSSVDTSVGDSNSSIGVFWRRSIPNESAKGKELSTPVSADNGEAREGKRLDSAPHAAIQPVQK